MTSNTLKSPSPSSSSSGLKRGTPTGNTSNSLHSSSSSPSLDRLGLSGGSRTPGSLSSMGKLSSTLPSSNAVGSVYDKVYRALEFLSVDPNRNVNSMAQTLVVYLRQKVKSKDSLSRPSFSIPANIQDTLKTSSVPSSPAKESGLDAVDHHKSSASRSTPPPVR